MILDAVTGEPVSAASVRDGSTVYAWTSGYTATTLSLPPQTIPEVLLVNIPAGLPGAAVRCDRAGRWAYKRRYSGPQRNIRHAVRRKCVSGVGGRENYALSYPESRYLSGFASRYSGADMADDAGQAERVLVFPYAYPGYLALNGCGRLYINGTATLEPSALRRPYGDARLYAPIRAVGGGRRFSGLLG